MDAFSETKPGGEAGEAAPSASDFFSSAQVVAEAAQACFQSGADKVDKAKVAGAASDLLGAASRYGNLDEKGYGGYVKKAETYLEQYSSGAPVGAAPAAAAAADSTTPAPAEGEAKSEGATHGGGFLSAAKGLLGDL